MNSTATLLVTKVFVKAWRTEDQSVENHSYTASGLDGILLGRFSLLLLFPLLFGLTRGTTFLWTAIIINH